MNELWWGVYGGGVTNLAVAAVLNNTFFEASGRTWLVTLGAWNELLGVLLVASPELIPRLHHVLSFIARRLRSAFRRLVTAIGNLLRIPRSPLVVQVGKAGTMELAGRGVTLKSTIHGIDLTQQVEFLLKRTSEHEKRLDLIEPELERIREEIRSSTQEVRVELRREQEALERRLADKRISLRLLGLAYVVLGLVLGWGGNLVGV
jgi:hypothetical protein